jgi:hypothetical protein
MSVIVEITQGGTTASVTVSSAAADKAAAAASAVAASASESAASASAIAAASSAVTAAVAVSDTIMLDITSKGNGDAIPHSSEATLRVVSFWDSDDGGRQSNVFYSSSQTTTQFTLNNDFTNDKYNGTLLCIKYS